MGNTTPTPEQTAATPTAEQIKAFEKEQKLRIQEDELVKRIKRRFTVALISVSVVGFFGIQAVAWIVIDQMFRPRMDAEVAKAIAAVSNADRAADNALSATSKATRAAKIAMEIANAVSVQARKLTKELEKIQVDMKVARNQIRTQIEERRREAAFITEKLVKDLEGQLKRVGTQVVALTKLAEKSALEIDREQTNLQKAKSFEREQTTLRDTAGRTRKALAANSKFRVSLRPSKQNLSLAEKLAKKFEEAGFRLNFLKTQTYSPSNFSATAKYEEMTAQAFIARPIVRYQATHGEAKSKIDAIRKIAEPLLGGETLKFHPTKDVTMPPDYFALYLP